MGITRGRGHGKPPPPYKTPHMGGTGGGHGKLHKKLLSGTFQSSLPSLGWPVKMDISLDIPLDKMVALNVALDILGPSLVLDKLARDTLDPFSEKMSPFHLLTWPDVIFGLRKMATCSSVLDSSICSH